MLKAAQLGVEYAGLLPAGFIRRCTTSVHEFYSLKKESPPGKEGSNVTVMNEKFIEKSRIEIGAH